MLEHELFSTCGLSGTEQLVLLDLLEREGSTAGALAKRLQLKRATAYSALQNLEDWGLVIRNRGPSVTIYSTVPPTMVPQILCDAAKKQYEDVERASKLLESQMAEYRRKSKQKIKGYEINTADSRESAFSIVLDVLTGYDFCSIFDPHTAATGPSEANIIKFAEYSVINKPSIRDIVVDGPRAEWYLKLIYDRPKVNPNHKAKLLPAKYGIITDFIIANDSVYLTNYDPGAEMLIQIKHRDYYDSMMSVFNFVWEHLPELELR